MTKWREAKKTIPNGWRSGSYPPAEAGGVWFKGFLVPDTSLLVSRVIIYENWENAIILTKL